MVPLLIILDPKNNCFSQSCRLWRYVTGDIPKPISRPVTDSSDSDANSVADAVIPVDDFGARLEEWESMQDHFLIY